MLYAIGDIHGNVDFMIQKLETIPREALLPVYVILLGDAGLNFYLDKRDDRQKETLQIYLNQREDAMKLLFETMRQGRKIFVLMIKKRCLGAGSWWRISTPI